MTRCNSPPLTMSNPLPRLASVRNTDWLELDFIAKQTRCSTGDMARSNSWKCRVSVRCEYT
jgi:hypothetical protein